MADFSSEMIRQAVLQARNGHPQEALSLLLGNPPPAGSADAPHYHLTVGSLLLEQGRPGEAFAHLDVVIHREGKGKPAVDLWQAARQQTELKLGRGSLDRASTSLESWVDNPFYMPLEALLAVLATAAAIRCYRKSLSPASRRVGLRWAALIWVVATAVGTAQLLGSRYPRSRAASAFVLRSGPADDFFELGQIEAGVELRLLEKQEGWVRVRVTPEVSGWAPASNVLLLSPPSNTRES